MLYFYFNFTDAAKRSTENAVRSLIHQLYGNCAMTQPVLDSLYAAYDKSGQPAHSELQDTLLAMISATDEVWIILDGLDECETEGRQPVDGVIPWIKRLRMPNVHLLVTSRPEQNIKVELECWAGFEELIPLQSSVVAEDISAYIHTKVRQMSRWESRLDIQNLIMVTLHTRACGM